MLQSWHSTNKGYEIWSRNSLPTPSFLLICLLPFFPSWIPPLPGSLSRLPGRVHISLHHILLALNLYSLKYYLKPESCSFSHPFRSLHSLRQGTESQQGTGQRVGAQQVPSGRKTHVSTGYVSIYSDNKENLAKWTREKEKLPPFTAAKEVGRQER